MKRGLYLVLALVVAFFLLTVTALSSAARSLPPATPTPLPPDEAAVEKAILEAARLQSERVLAYLVYEQKVVNVKISTDGKWAVALLVLLDAETGEPAHIEPGLALAEWDGSTWRAILPADADWPAAVRAAPVELLPDEMRQAYLAEYETELAHRPTAPLSGYLLPWAAGETRYLSQSVGHDAYTPSGSMHFAFDFYIPSSTHDAMWNIYAAKSGTVKWRKWDVPTCYQFTCSDAQPLGNYIVLEDLTTNPPSYQLYLHLAYDSIPPYLRQYGAQVVQGQFIGVADNTGQSWGSHLHFQVHTNPSSYFGTAVDIVFSDVDINGGRPRVQAYDQAYCKPSDVCTAFRPNYVSANVPKSDIGLPSGAITLPALGALIQAPVVTLSGWGADADSGLSSAQFMAYYGNAWHDIGPLFTSESFDYSWDMCAADVPDGAVALGLRLTDGGGNTNPLSGLTHFTKNYACTPPPDTCVPDADDVVLFSEAGFAGTCVSFGVGAYPDGAALGTLGSDNAASLRVGSQVMATLFNDPNFSDRAETFIADDANLADNLIGLDRASSLMVALRSSLPLTPTGITGVAWREDWSVNLGWYNGGNATHFQARLNGISATLTSTLLTEPVWRLGSLDPMTYTWQVRGYNAGGGFGPWSLLYTLVAPSPSPLPSPVAAPVTFDMETSAGWLEPGTWGWKSASANTPARSGTYSFWYQGSGGDYDTGLPTFGSLTSPPITLPPSGSYYLRFWYRYESETHGIHWDQRWVQISVNDGPFDDVLQLYDDPMFDESEEWLQSPAVDLSPYAGQTIRVRFDFTSLDAAGNAFRGWGIDDVSITATPPPACADGNDAPATATTIAYEQTLSAEICPNGDVDYYQFNGAAGDHIAARVTAQAAGSPLDAYLSLLDSDGQSVLAEKDDDLPGVLTDPSVGYTLPHAGTYYLKVRAFNHPSAGGPTFDYNLYLFTDTNVPQAVMTAPANDAYLPNATLNLTVVATDTQSGVSHVDFFWHDGAWLSSAWRSLGSDWNGADGWSFPFNAVTLADQKDIAFYAHVYDAAGNWVGTGSWGQRVDRTPPYTALTPVSPLQYNTAFTVTWTAYDAIAGLNAFDLQWDANLAGWQDYASGLAAQLRQTWIVGAPGGIYGLRLRGIDAAGNVEAYPSEAETTTFITNTICTTFDAYEADNTLLSARLVSSSVSEDHTFCNPISATLGLDDEDWLAIPAVAGTRYLAIANPLASSPAAAELSLFDSDGVTLTHTAAPSFGQLSLLDWISDRDETVYLRVRHGNGRVAGPGVAYRLTLIFAARSLFLPIIRR